MISLQDLALQRGGRLLFSEVTVRLHHGQRFGLTGANGSGKSSLFQLMLGQLQADSGELDIPARTVISHVSQETPGVEQAAIEYVMDGDIQLRKLQSQMQSAEGEALATLLAGYETIGGYTADARAATLMHGLGFIDSQLKNAVASFSGGWRMRLNLAQALMQQSDLLLLDEPTNHLDLDAVIWLENWLRNYDGILILISHDREFLDAVVTHVMQLEQHTITTYAGNYSAFEKQRAAQLEQQAANYKKQQKEIAHLHSFVDRFRAKATKARQAQSRLKALDRMDIITAAHIDSPFHFQFFEATRAGDPMLKMDEVVAGYNDTIILDGIQFQLRPGSRVGLLGPNGAGKSTLIKLLAGTLKEKSGERIESQGLKIGYFAQHQLEQLDASASALLHLSRQDTTQAREQQMRDYLGGFGFKGERVDEAIEPFSGGEKARLALALLVWQKPNLLLLDEPTNHLDLDMRHAITVALQAFEGAMVIVSHDRHLLRTCADELFIVHAGQCEPFDGDLDDYRKTLNEAISKHEQTVVADAEPKSDRKQQRRNAAEQRRLQHPIKNKINKLEKEMAVLQPLLEEIEDQLSVDEIYQSGSAEKLKLVLAEQAKAKTRLDEIEEQWLELTEQLEEIIL